MIPFGTTLAHYEAFKREVQAMPGVQAAATAHIAMYSGYNLWSAQLPGSDKQLMLRVMEVDNDFTGLLGLKWKTKPPASENLYDGRHILLNEKAVEQLGLDNNPLGHQITMGSEKFIVGGVLNNFNYQSLKNGIGPLGLFVGNDTARKWGTTSGGCLYVRINAHVNLPSTIDALKAGYKRHDRDRAFEYHFLDDAFDKVYAAEDRMAGLFGVFTAVAIVIGCLGLFALATFAAQQRIREIGIRKVLGASTVSLGALLSVDFLKPVALSALIASPLAWWLLRSWLEKFAYRTVISWWLFPLAAAVLLCIALASVLARSWRAATGNPVTALRSE
jgi:putative ABC transport system permease protein